MRDKLDKLQDDTIKELKQLKGNKQMKTIKEPKAPKTYTLKQIIKSIMIILALIGAGAFIGITIDRAINNTISKEVKVQTAEQVKVFTEAVEVKE